MKTNYKLEIHHRQSEAVAISGCLIGLVSSNMLSEQLYYQDYYFELTFKNSFLENINELVSVTTCILLSYALNLS